jgi:DNA-directed RNA polymerase subunit RPC12/RpoP
MTLLVTICSQCGDPFDSTEYPLCNDCRYDHRFIKLRKPDESKDQINEEGIKSDERV